MNTTPQRNIEANSGRIIECVQKTISTRPVEVHSKWLEHYLITLFFCSPFTGACTMRWNYWEWFDRRMIGLVIEGIVRGDFFKQTIGLVLLGRFHNIMHRLPGELLRVEQEVRSIQFRCNLGVKQSSRNTVLSPSSRPDVPLWRDTSKGRLSTHVWAEDLC